MGGTCSQINEVTVITRSDNSTEPVLVLARQILQASVAAANHRLRNIYRFWEHDLWVGPTFFAGTSLGVYQTNFTEQSLSRKLMNTQMIKKFPAYCGI